MRENDFFLKCSLANQKWIWYWTTSCTGRPMWDKNKQKVLKEMENTNNEKTIVLHLQVAMCNKALKNWSEIATCGSLCFWSAEAGNCRDVSVLQRVHGTLPWPAWHGKPLGRALLITSVWFCSRKEEKWKLFWDTVLAVKCQSWWFIRREWLAFSSFLRSNNSIGDPAKLLSMVLKEYLELYTAFFCTVRISVGLLTSLGYTSREFWLQLSYSSRDFASYWQVSGWVQLLTLIKNYIQGDPTFQWKGEFS